MPWPHACPSFHNESQYVKSFEKLIALEPNECGDQEKIDHGCHDHPEAESGGDKDTWVERDV